MNPLLNPTKNRPYMSSSPTTSIHNLVKTEEIPTSVLAAAPSLRLNNNKDNESTTTPFAASLSMLPPNQQYQFNQAFNRSLFLNTQTQSQPYLNNLQLQALIHAAALENASNPLQQDNHHHHHHQTSFSMSSLPNPNNKIKRQRTAISPPLTNNRNLFIPQFGNIAHVEEENEMLLANELKDASKCDEEMHNAFIYGDDDDEDDADDDDEETDEVDNRLRGFHSYNAAVHRHPKHLTKKISCYSDPYLMRSNLLNQQIHSNDEMTVSTESLARFSRLNDRRNTLNAENEMDFVSGERPVYKYTTGLVYDSRMLKHECICHNSKNHIETPTRIQAIWSRFESRGVLDECEVIKCKMASIEDISICHSKLYSSIYGADIELRSKLKREFLQEYFMSICMAPCNGLALVSDQDNSWNEEFTPIACRVAVGSTYELAELVTLGKLKNGFALVRPPGSHAEHNKPL